VRVRSRNWLRQRQLKCVSYTQQQRQSTNFVAAVIRRNCGFPAIPYRFFGVWLKKSSHSFLFLSFVDVVYKWIVEYLVSATTTICGSVYEWRRHQRLPPETGVFQRRSLRLLLIGHVYILYITSLFYSILFLFLFSSIALRVPLQELGIFTVPNGIFLFFRFLEMGPGSRWHVHTRLVCFSLPFSMFFFLSFLYKVWAHTVRILSSSFLFVSAWADPAGVIDIVRPLAHAPYTKFFLIAFCMGCSVREWIYLNHWVFFFIWKRGILQSTAEWKKERPVF